MLGYDLWTHEYKYSFHIEYFFLCVLLSKNAVSQNYIQYKSALSCVVL